MGYIYKQRSSMIKPMYLQSKGMSPFFLDTYKRMLYSYIILIRYEINKLVQNKIGGIKNESKKEK